jgi:hypothetical protein
VNNGDNIPNGDLVQKLRCSICFPHVLVLIEKKTKGKKKSLHTSFGISLMKRHVESKHVELLTAYVVDVSYH